jgi:hypothetical protein
LRLRADVVVDFFEVFGRRGEPDDRELFARHVAILFSI